MNVRPWTGAWWFEDFEEGQVFTSQGRTILESDIAAFAALTWDTNPVHTDFAAAAKGRFGTSIAHGLLGVSVAMGLASRIGVFEACSVALLGIERWTFHAPLRAGDTVECAVRIDSAKITSSGRTGILHRTFELRNQSGEKVQSGRIDLLVACEPGQRGLLG